MQTNAADGLSTKPLILVCPINSGPGKYSKDPYQEYESIINRNFELLSGMCLLKIHPKIPSEFPPEGDLLFLPPAKSNKLSGLKDVSAFLFL